MSVSTPYKTLSVDARILNYSQTTVRDSSNRHHISGIDLLLISTYAWNILRDFEFPETKEEERKIDPSREAGSIQSRKEKKRTQALFDVPKKTTSMKLNVLFEGN